MVYTTLVSTGDLARRLGDPAWAIVDCRYSLADKGQGRRDYLNAHIPGAVYAHLDEDLAGPVIPGKTGRHPLPPVEKFAKTLSRFGIGPGIQVVVYDDQGGAYAARLWWMLRWVGHEAAAVLDGGFPAWIAEDRPVRAGNEDRKPLQFIPQPHPELVVSAEQVDKLRQRPDFRLIDARSAERYNGRNETVDPIAGHIPGALSAPYDENLSPEGKLLPPETLRKRYQALLGAVPPENAVFYCGSGVTAAHDLLAMLHAGLGQSRLFAGSWSEWITDPRRPLA